MTRTMKRKCLWLLAVAACCAVLGVIYVHTHPLVFNESMWGHAHCIKIAGFGLLNFAAEHGGKYPFNPKGYGNALLQVNEDSYFALTGPGFDAAAFHKAKRTHGDLREEDCGRVYVQGLSEKSDSRIALLFDKLATPGGDHCPFPIRMWAPLGREVWFVGCYSSFIREDSWPEFAQEQIELLVKEGFERREAERVYAPTNEK
jgi:hypothetical protein